MGFCSPAFSSLSLSLSCQCQLAQILRKRIGKLPFPAFLVQMGFTQYFHGTAFRVLRPSLSGNRVCKGGIESPSSSPPLQIYRKPKFFCQSTRVVETQRKKISSWNEWIREEKKLKERKNFTARGTTKEIRKTDRETKPRDSRREKRYSLERLERLDISTVRAHAEREFMFSALH